MDCARLLLRAKASVNERTRTHFHGVLEHPLFVATVTGNLDMMRLLLEARADADGHGPNKVQYQIGGNLHTYYSTITSVPIVHAAKEGNLASVRLLLAAGADEKAPLYPRNTTM